MFVLFRQIQAQGRYLRPLKGSLRKEKGTRHIRASSEFEIEPTAYVCYISFQKQTQQFQENC